MSKHSKGEFRLNTGTSTLLFIFVILCLISFSILSLSSALSDLKLSERVSENTRNYYEACNEAEEQISEAEQSLKELYETGISRAGYFEQVGKKMTFSFPVSDIQSLNVEIKINYPDEDNNSFYDVVSWNVQTVNDLVYDDSLPVYK